MQGAIGQMMSRGRPLVRFSHENAVPFVRGLPNRLSNETAAQSGMRCRLNELAGIVVLRQLIIFVLLFSTISCVGPQSVELSVDRAVLTQNLGGSTAIEVFLTEKSGREFAAITSRSVGSPFEFRVLNEKLATVVFQTPILGGHFLISAVPDGPLTENNAGKIASMLSSKNAKLEVRILNEKK
jgi:hypothetical protein